MRHVVISADQKLLRDTAERFLRDRYSFEHREAIRRSTQGFDEAMWRSFTELGWLGMPFPAELGGFGGTMLDVALLAEILGPSLPAEPYMPTVAAGVAIQFGGTANQRKAIIPEICEGKLRLALAFVERNTGYSFDTLATRAEIRDGAFLLSGEKSVVIGAPSAHAIVVSARVDGDEGLSLFLVRADAPRLTMRSYATIDGQRAAEIHLDSVHVEATSLLGERGRGLALLTRACDVGTVILLGEAAGILQSALDLTADYLNLRIQFDRKLASFQALRHRIARMYVGKEEVRALCRQAAAALADDPESADTCEAISAAKVHVGRVGRRICEEAVQLHGAIAISDEYIVGHFLKRMVAIDHMFGNANHHFDRYVSQARSLSPQAP
jgi:alkylation response protein AidB-like acyl-CoA dehydrogenase